MPTCESCSTAGLHLVRAFTKIVTRVLRVQLADRVVFHGARSGCGSKVTKLLRERNRKQGNKKGADATPLSPRHCPISFVIQKPQTVHTILFHHGSLLAATLSRSLDLDALDETSPHQEYISRGSKACSGRDPYHAWSNTTQRARVVPDGTHHTVVEWAASPRSGKQGPLREGRFTSCESCRFPRGALAPFGPCHVPSQPLHQYPPHPIPDPRSSLSSYPLARLGISNLIARQRT